MCSCVYAADNCTLISELCGPLQMTCVKFCHLLEYMSFEFYLSFDTQTFVVLTCLNGNAIHSILNAQFT